MFAPLPLPRCSVTPQELDLLLNRSAVARRRLSTLVAWDGNPRLHDEGQLRMLAKSLAVHGLQAPIIVQKGTDKILAGHGRRLALLRMAEAAGSDPEIDVIEADLNDDEAKSYAIADNRLQELSTWDNGLLRAAVSELDTGGWDMEALGYDPDGLASLFGAGSASGLGGDGAETTGLVERFGAPPFSLLDPNQAYWQARMALWLDLGCFSLWDARAADWGKRKEAWVSLGLKSEAGREENLTFAKSAQSPNVYKLRNEMRAAAGGVDPSWDEIIAEAEKRGVKIAEGTSIFDPVLCELLYSWFCPMGGAILDPFAGGSVRGVVAAALARPYTGIDLRPEQVAENRAQWGVISNGIPEWPTPTWVEGDSQNVATLAPGSYDFIMSCPPYGDLEVYSDAPEDLSNMGHSEFMEAYRRIIKESCALLKQDRFAAWVIGDFRDGSGNYRNFVSDTISAFLAAGLTLYNEAVLITPLASLPMRAGRQFAGSRKLGKGHQNVLVFLKGDSKKAVEALGEVCVMNPFAAFIAARSQE